MLLNRVLFGNLYIRGRIASLLCSGLFEREPLEKMEVLELFALEIIPDRKFFGGTARKAFPSILGGAKVDLGRGYFDRSKLPPIDREPFNWD